MAELDDQQLLAEFTSANSETAFASLVGRYVNLVYSTALRFAGNPQAAEEISQAVFIILARKAAGLGRSVVLSGWLYQTARLTAANYVKQDIRRQRREQEAYMQSTLNEPKAPTWEDIAPLLDEAMGGLGETDRTAIVLRFFENKTAREVAATLKMTEAAAHMRVHRALGKLHKFLTKRGVASSAAVIAGAVSSNSVHAAPAGLASSLSTVALAKGAAASASTLTLVNGGLKLMAWTKTKAIVAGAAIALMGIGTTTVVLNELLPLPDIQGTWEGTVDAERPGLGVHKGESPKDLLVMRITKVNGAYQATVDSISGGDKGIGLDTFTYKYPFVHIELKSDNFSAVGKVNRFGGKLTLTCQQGTNSYPAVFRETMNPTPFPEPLTYEEIEPSPGSALQGFWTGKIGQRKMHVDPLDLPINFELKIGGESNGTYRADFDCPDESGPRQPAEVSYDGSTVKLTLWDGCGMFEGQLRNGGKEITGDWIQDGNRTRTTMTWEDYSNAWENPNLSSALVDLAYPQVRILPTKFPRSAQTWQNGQGTKFGGINRPVSSIMRVAYFWWPARLVFAVPEPKGGYDFIASLPQGSREALKRELLKQFGLLARVETRDEDVLVLRVRTPNAPGLKPPNVGGQQDWYKNGEYICDDRPLSSDDRPWGLQLRLEYQLKMPVVDETGLTNHFSIDLKWKEGGQKDPDHKALKQALADQLGLEVVPARRPIGMLVIEQGALVSPTAEAALSK